VADAQRVTVTLNNVADALGNSATSISTTIAVLLGDVDGNGRVDGNDVSAVQSHTRQVANSNNFPYDVDLNGRIDGNDVSATQSHTRNALP
jgi:Dockerin type I domain